VLDDAVRRPERASSYDGKTMRIGDGASIVEGQQQPHLLEA